MSKERIRKERRRIVLTAKTQIIDSIKLEMPNSIYESIIEESIEKAFSLKESDFNNILQWCFNYINKQKDSDEKKRLIEELTKLGCL